MKRTSCSAVMMQYRLGIRFTEPIRRICQLRVILRSVERIVALWVSLSTETVGSATYFS